MGKRASIWAAAALTALAATALLVPSGSAMAAACTPLTNVEAIVDDSGSMSFTDENKLRVQGLDLLIEALPGATQLGAVEFGSGDEATPPADVVFAPGPVGADAAAMKKALAATINADNGATDYNGAFAVADAANPAAQARIFLTDGGHDIGEYANGHLAHPVPTYVLGFGSGLAEAADQERLNRIAAETGGSYFPLSEASQLPSVINEIGASLSCQTTRTFTDQLGANRAKSHSVAIAAGTQAVQVALTWPSPLDRVKFKGFKLLAGGSPVAVAGRPKVRKLHVKYDHGKTFVLAKVSGLSKGRLVFKIAAASIGSGTPKVTVTTQVSKRRHG